MLSNKATGVFFNDSTKIVLDPGGHFFDYYERRSSDKKDVGKEHTLTDYPKELAKKVTLLQHFRSYLESGEKKDGGGDSGAPAEPDANFLEEKKIDEENKEAVSTTRQLENIVYVKKWMRTRHAIMFRLSNKIVQVNF